MQGELPAYNNLGYLNYQGMGIEANRGEAIRLWNYAADRYFPEAHRHLGSAYLDRKFLPRDPDAAYFRFKVAQVLADRSQQPSDATVAAQARAGMNAVRKELDPARIEAAEALAADYLRREPLAGK